MKVTQNIAQYPLHHVTYAFAQFEVAMSSGFGRISIYKKRDTRRHRQMEGRQTDLGTKLFNPVFLKKEAGIITDILSFYY